MADEEHDLSGLTNPNRVIRRRLEGEDPGDAIPARGARPAPPPPSAASKPQATPAAAATATPPPIMTQADFARGRGAAPDRAKQQQGLAEALRRRGY